MNGTWSCSSGKYYYVLRFAKQAHSFFFFFNELYLSLQNPVSIQNMLVIFQNNFPGSSTPFGMDQGEAETHEYKTMGQVMVGSTAAPPPPPPQLQAGDETRTLEGPPSSRCGVVHLAWTSARLPGVYKSIQPCHMLMCFENRRIFLQTTFNGNTQHPCQEI